MVSILIAVSISIGVYFAVSIDDSKLKQEYKETVGVDRDGAVLPEL